LLRLRVCALRVPARPSAAATRIDIADVPSGIMSGNPGYAAAPKRQRRRRPRDAEEGGSAFPRARPRGGADQVRQVAVVQPEATDMDVETSSNAAAGGVDGSYLSDTR
jgi:hypothetical protein